MIKSDFAEILTSLFGGNAGEAERTAELWRENDRDDNFNTIETEYDKQQLARQVYTLKMRQARKIHANAIHN